MEKTYRIEVTLNLCSKESAKDAVYAYLCELIDDDSLHFEPVNRGNTAIKLLQTEF